MQSVEQVPTGGAWDRKVAGWMLVSSSVAAIGLMSQHPTFGDSPVMLRHMHGSIIAIMLVQAVGLLLYARQRPTTVNHVGMFFFVLAVISGLAAGMVNGFIAPAMMERFPRAGHHALYRLLWEANQATAVAGVLMTSVAYGWWAADLWQRHWRVTAVAACAAALIPATALLGNFVAMDIGGAQFCYAIQAAWAIWLGVVLVRFHV